MKLKDSMKGFIAGLGSAAILAGVVVPALAGPSVYKQIDAYTGVDVVVNGQQITPRNASGHVVDTFIFNDTTYVPVRALSEYWGKDVAWDGDSRTVYVTDKQTSNPGNDSNSGNTGTTQPSQPSKPSKPEVETGYLTDVLKPAKNSKAYAWGNLSSAIMNDKLYSNIIEFSDGGQIEYNLGGNYKTIKGTIGYEDVSKYSYSGVLSFYGDDKLIASYPITSGKTQNITIDVSNVKEFRITHKEDNSRNADAIFAEITIE